jgi:hypothetical protein
MPALMRADVESARRDWAEGWRRLQEESREPRTAERLHLAVAVVTDELRRRIGGTFTLAELAGVYADAERWAREVVADQAAGPAWPRSLSLVQDAAFHLYARGAIDYEP